MSCSGCSKCKKGPPGPQGPTGPAGVGAPGASGATGAGGGPGATGATGVGTLGATGATGVGGATGTQGPTGPSGAAAVEIANGGTGTLDAITTTNGLGAPADLIVFNGGANTLLVGLVGGTPGRAIDFFNADDEGKDSLNLGNDVAAIPAQGILTGVSPDASFGPNTGGRLVYSGTLNRWLLTATNTVIPVGADNDPLLLDVTGTRRRIGT